MPKLEDKKKEGNKEKELKVELANLLKSRMPACFEKEPPAAFATGNLDRLVEDILRDY